MFWYVQPKTTAIQPGTRVISDKVKPDYLYTSNLQGSTVFEQKIFDLIRNDKVFYSTNLTGTEFKEAIAFFINNKIGRWYYGRINRNTVNQ